MRQVGVNGEQTVSIAEYTCILKLDVQLVGENIAFFLDNIERLGEPEFFFTILLLINHQLKTEIFTKTVGVDNRTGGKVAACSRVGKV